MSMVNLKHSQYDYFMFIYILHFLEIAYAKDANVMWVFPNVFLFSWLQPCDFPFLKTFLSFADWKSCLLHFFKHKGCNKNNKKKEQHSWLRCFKMIQFLKMRGSIKKELACWNIQSRKRWRVKLKVKAPQGKISHCIIFWYTGRSFKKTHFRTYHGIYELCWIIRALLYSVGLMRYDSCTKQMSDDICVTRFNFMKMLLDKTDNYQIRMDGGTWG